MTKGNSHKFISCLRYFYTEKKYFSQNGFSKSYIPQHYLII